MALTGEKHHQINSDKCGKLNVYTMGDDHAEVVILTVHDLGCNHRTFNNLATHQAWTNITKKALWVHVDVPGQEDDAPDLASGFKFPTMQHIAEGLLDVVNTLGIKQCVLLGEGAGANICARFAMLHDDRVLGACLVHCTGTTAGFMEKMKDKIITYRLKQEGMNPTAEHYLETHRFGEDHHPENEEVTRAVELFKQDLKTKINPRNLRLFVETFLVRTPLVDKASDMKINILLATGKNASHNHTVHTLYSALNTSNLSKPEKKTVELLEIDDVANIILEAPDSFGQSFLFFVQGLGKLGHLSSASGRKESLTLRGRTMSMEEADLPKGPESLTKVPGRKTSVPIKPVAE